MEDFKRVLSLSYIQHGANPSILKGECHSCSEGSFQLYFNLAKVPLEYFCKLNTHRRLGKYSFFANIANRDPLLGIKPGISTSNAKPI